MMEIDEVVEWFARARKPRLGPDEAQELYFRQHPRTLFIKALPSNAKVVDIGAGDGSLSVFRGWPEPVRDDLGLYAYSIEKGTRFDDFDGYEISDWNLQPPEFEGIRFDAVVSGHFIEHIDEPGSLATWMARKLVPGGRAYIEWPSPHSLDLPSQRALAERGVPLTISRFDDDCTHQVLPTRDAVVSGLELAGFDIEQQGIVRMPWIEEQLMASFRDSEDGFCRQAAFWLMTGWSQFVIAARKEERLTDVTQDDGFDRVDDAVTPTL
jgi:SAM-dependent methyltransferase